MSTTESFGVNYTTLAVLAAGLAGGYAVSKFASSSSSSSQPSPTLQSSTSTQQKPGSKTKKKKSPTQQTVLDQAQPLLEKAAEVKDQVVAAASSAVQVAKEPPVVQRAVETVTEAAVAAQEAVESAAGKKKKKGKKASSAKAGSPPSSSPAPEAHSTAVAPAPPAAAEAHAAKTALSFDAAVADMRDEGVDPQPKVARTMKLVGGKAGADLNSLQVPGQEVDEGWERPDSVDEDDGEWTSVVSKKPSRPSTPSGLVAAASPQRVVPGMATAPLTKKQRENAAKKEKADALKAEKEREQEARLAAYRKEQDRAKTAELNAARQHARPRSQNFFGSEPVAPPVKAVGGGMSASLDPTSGSLVWD
ncbi:hypothetical protein JCM11641_005329 [Rhodosporidiobolus odoratus]